MRTAIPRRAVTQIAVAGIIIGLIVGAAGAALYYSYTPNVTTITQTVTHTGTQSSSSSTVSTQSSAPFATVKVSWIPILALTPFCIANKLGYFTQQHLNIESTIIGPYAALPLLASGKFDVGLGADSAASFNAFSSGADVKVVASRLAYIDHGDGAVAVLTTKYNSGINSFAKLAGKSIATDFPSGSLSDWYLGVMMRKASLSKSNFTSIEVLGGGPDGLAALKNGAVAGAVIDEPYLTDAVQFGNVTILPNTYVHQIIPGAQGTLLYSGNFTRANPSAANRFTTASMRG